jgi:nicotinamidase-related amidase
MSKALFVIDVQKFFENKNTKSVAKKISKYIKVNKGDYSLIIFTVFKNNSESPLWNIFGWKGCGEGKDIEIMDELSDLVDKSKIIFRNTYSLLKAPGIKEKLKEYEIGQIDICGFDTDACILATTYDLFDSGYKPIILKNLCFSTSKEKLHRAALKIIKRNCGFLA